MHKKYISDEEVEIIQLLHELSLGACTLVYDVKDNILREYEGVHVSRCQWDICKINEEIIVPFRNIKSKSFTPGFYSHMNAPVSVKETDYRLYLLRELNEILEGVKEKNINKLKYIVFRYVVNAVEGLINDGIEINHFCLLHGDLYNGNILMYNGKYSMIDFEYVRFGPPQLEWTFLLFWDLLTEPDTRKRQPIFVKVIDDIRILRKKKILNEIDIKLIMDIFLPAVISLSLHFSEMGRFANYALIHNGMTVFWNREYREIKERL